MRENRQKIPSMTAHHRALVGSQHEAILVVGTPETLRNAGETDTLASDIHCIDFDQIDPMLFELLRPKAVVSPLVTDEFDCLDLAARLQKMGFAGVYRAVGPNLPNPDLICREVRASCPTVDFDIVSSGAPADQLLH